MTDKTQVPEQLDDEGVGGKTDQNVIPNDAENASGTEVESTEAATAEVVDASATDASDNDVEHRSAHESRKVAEAQNESQPTIRSKRGFPWFGLLLALLMLVTIFVVVWLAWQGDQYIKGDTEKYAQVKILESQLSQQAQQLIAINQALGESLAAAKASGERANERLQIVEQRVIAQNKRLLAMSTVTREDWLLAEAEYLLKLANQRVLIERSAEGAEALLTEADAIMRDLADPDLYPLRKAINNDLAALRLVQKIDVEGIYLAIDGLVNHIEALPLQPTRQQVMINSEDSALRQQGEPGTGANGEAVEAESGWLAKVRSSFSGFTEGLSEYIRVRDHSVEARALLAPDATHYLQHNIQLLLERAQLALLREQPQIYSQSLLQAESYISKFLPASTAADNFRAQLKALSDKTIVAQLPDISPSLELLHAYIEELHNLKGATPAAGGSQP